MGNPITLFEDDNGDVWYKDFRIDQISCDEAHGIGSNTYGLQTQS